MLRYFILLPALLFTSFFVHAQEDFEVGFGLLGSGAAVNTLPIAYRGDFAGPITYLGYYVEGATLLLNHNKWKPRAIVRFQSEGNNASDDWPEMRFLGGSAGCMVSYQFTPVISVVVGGLANYQISSQVNVPTSDQPRINMDKPWSGRLNAGVRGDFGRWCSEMLVERSFTTQTGAVLLSREGSPAFQPSYSMINVRLGVKYQLYQSKKS